MNGLRTKLVNWLYNDYLQEFQYGYDIVETTNKQLFNNLKTKLKVINKLVVRISHCLCYGNIV